MTSPDGEEYIDVSIQDNIGRLTPLDWYKEQAPNVNTAQVLSVQNFSKTVAGVRSVDGLSTHYGYGNNIFTLFYATNNKQKVDFKTSYLLVGGSFEILPASSIISNINESLNTNTNSNSNTNANSNQSVNSNTNTNTNTNANSNTNSAF
jgi:hypothetical protein